MRYYESIDIIKTGRRIKQLIKWNDYTVKEIQQVLQLSCPQPIYRWMSGKILPTVDHLYILSQLFGIHMEEIIVPKRVPMNFTFILIKTIEALVNERCFAYYQRSMRKSEAL